MPKELFRRAFTFGLTALLCAPACAQWVSLGDMPAPRRDGNALVFRDGRTIISASVITPQIIRVRFSPTPAFGRDHSYATVFAGPADASAIFDVHDDSSSVTTAALRVLIRHKPFRIEFSDASGNSLDQDDPARGIAWSGPAVRVWKRLLDDEH